VGQDGVTNALVRDQMVRAFHRRHHIRTESGLIACKKCGCVFVRKV
jgi:hypothetical protein